MFRYLLIFILGLSTNTLGQQIDQHFVDTIGNYYFNISDETTSFTWGTIPKNFNFNWYTIHFINDTDEVIRMGRCTTGDGRVSYRYDKFPSDDRVVYPGESFSIRPFHNGQLRHRYNRFSKSVLMTYSKGDSTYSVHHKYIGDYSQDTVIVDQIKKTKDDILITRKNRYAYWAKADSIRASQSTSPAAKEKIIPSQKKIVEEELKEIGQVNIRMRENNGLITDTCELQVFEGKKWIELTVLMPAEGSALFKYEFEVGPNRVKIRWRKQKSGVWNYDWLYLNRLSNQFFEKINEGDWINYSDSGRSKLKVKERSYRINITYSPPFNETNKVLDSVKQVLNWYGIPYEKVTFREVVLKNDQDQYRLNRAIRKHFNNALVVPMMEKGGEESYLYQTVYVLFKSTTDTSACRQILRDHHVENFYYYSPYSSNKKVLLFTISFDDVINPNYKKILETLYELPEIEALRTEVIDIPKLD